VRGKELHERRSSLSSVPADTLPGFKGPSKRMLGFREQAKEGRKDL